MLRSSGPSHRTDGARLGQKGAGSRATARPLPRPRQLSTRRSCPIVIRHKHFSTRPLDQIDRTLDEAQVADLLAGAYWLVPPGPQAELAIVYTGVLAPEAMAAFEAVLEDIPQAGLLAVVSPDLLHRDWSAALTRRARGEPGLSHIERLLGRLAPDAVLATAIDGPPVTLSWLGGVLGQRVAPLGLDRFGQSGDIPDLYRTYRLDADAILDAAALAVSPLPR